MRNATAPRPIRATSAPKPGVVVCGTVVGGTVVGGTVVGGAVVGGTVTGAAVVEVEDGAVVDVVGVVVVTAPPTEPPTLTAA